MMSEEFEESAWLGRVVGGHYEIAELLVETVHSRIFWGRNLLDGGPDAAIKVAFRHDEDPFPQDRLHREGSVLALFDGVPGVPRLFDRHYTEDRHLVLLMELLDGMPLSWMLERGDRRLDLGEVLSLFPPVVRALSELHRHGLIHRNLHPNKLFRCWEPPGLHLLGFGDAVFVQPEAGGPVSRFLGLPKYVAPEVWAGRSDVDARCDVYSLATIIYRALAGRCPFEMDSGVDLLDADVRAEIPSLARQTPGLSPELDEWARLALCPNRDERFHNVEAMWNAFVGAAGSGGVVALERGSSAVGS